MNAADEVIDAGSERSGLSGIAVISDHDQYSYAQLNSLVNQFGNAMKSRGIGRDNRILFMLDDSVELVAAYLAAMRIGAVSVAYNLRATCADLKYVLEESCAVLFFVDQALSPLYAEIKDDLNNLPAVVVNGAENNNHLSMEEFIHGQEEALETQPMSPDDMAFWIYSSGTTGRPKAAVHLHRNVLISDRHLVENLGVKPGDRLLCSSKLFFAFSLGHLLLGGLRAGAAIILHKGWPEPNSIATLVKTQRPDYFFSVPTFYRNLLNAGVADDPAFANIRCCVSAGEGLPIALFEKWEKKTGTGIFEGIGSSETVYLFIANNPASFRAGSSGRPQPWVETRLFDDNQQPVTNPDTPGLLWVKMGSTCDRYWNRPHKSHDTFVDGWYCTGDMFSFDAQGWWQHLGRQDAMLKISGQWVSPIEIEEQAMSANNVVDAAVVGAVNEDGLTRAMMFVVPGNPPEDREAFCQDLTNHLRKKLSIYKCPRKIRLVEQLPRTDTGKLKRFVLRQWMDDQAFH